MRNELIETQKRFQSYLKQDTYSFIAPVDDDNFKKFLDIVNRIVPSRFYDHVIHKQLSNRVATLMALAPLPASVKLQIYIVQIPENKATDDVLLHESLYDYCKKHKIDFK